MMRFSLFRRPTKTKTLLGKLGSLVHDAEKRGDDELAKVLTETAARESRLDKGRDKDYRDGSE